MKLNASVLMLAATALAALVATTTKHTDRRDDTEAPDARETTAPAVSEADAWFV